jgi:hypothetical protein
MPPGPAASILSILSGLRFQSLVDGRHSQRHYRTTEPPHQEFVMNFWIIMVPLSQLRSNVHFSIGPFRCLLNIANSSHQPVIFAGSSTGYRQIQEHVNAVVDNLCRLDFVNSVPKGHLTHNPVVHVRENRSVAFSQ